MKGISAALAVAALAVAAAPAAADTGAPGTALPGAPGTTFAEQRSSDNSPQPGSASSADDSETDGTMALVLAAVLLFAAIGGPLFGAESRPEWRNVDRKPSFRMFGSMRPEDWPPSDFKP
jgi:hypothetical protein